MLYIPHSTPRTRVMKDRHATRITPPMKRFPKGSSVLEYAILLGLVAIVCLIATGQVGLSTRSIFVSANNALTGTPVASTPQTPPVEEVVADPEPEKSDFYRVATSGAPDYHRGIGGRANQGVQTHLGAGLFLSYNGGNSATNLGQVSTILLEPGMATERNLSALGSINFLNNGRQRVVNVPSGFEGIPAVRMLIAQNPADLTGKQAHHMGWPMIAPGDRIGTLWGSSGGIISASTANIVADTNVATGHGAALLQAEMHIPGLGLGRWAVGSLESMTGAVITTEQRPEGFPNVPSTRAIGNYTPLTMERYQALVQQTGLHWPSKPYDTIPKPVLLGAQAGTAPGPLVGTVWGEHIVAPLSGGRVEPNGGQDTVHIAPSAGLTTIVMPTNPGQVAVTGYRSGVDRLVAPASLDPASVSQNDQGSNRVLTYTIGGGTVTVVLSGRGGTTITIAPDA